MHENEIIKGCPVIHASNPSVLGVLTGRKKTLPSGNIIMAQIQWPTNKQYEDIRSLKLKSPEDDDEMESTVARSEYGTIEDLRRRITYEKLQGTLTDIFYSMSASQIDFYPHQFKPVLKFIDSPANRLLLADEVGLGKTIEAGLIWTEWQARQDARRLLIVCPPSLCPKWERELVDRFQLPARILSIDDIATLRDRYASHGRKLSFVGICSYQTLSPKKKGKIINGLPFNEKALLDTLVEPAKANKPQIPDEKDLSKQARLLLNLVENDECADFVEMVIFDESHWMKNTDTTFHTLGSVLSRVSAASVCLSATPIHNKSRDLYSLLKLVDPDHFTEEAVFNSLRDRNSPVVHLLNRLVQPGTPKEEIKEACKEILASSYFAGSRVAQKVADIVENYSGEPNQAVRLYREAEKLNLLGSYITRTRKVQVLQKRVQRNPLRLDAPMIPEEKALYDGVLRLIRTMVRARGEQVTSFHLIAPALRMASCMPSMVQCLKEGRWGGLDELAELANDWDLDIEDDNLSTGLSDDLNWIRSYDFEKNDSKYAKLRQELFGQLQNEKVIIFAFFKDTIRYLHRRLTADGFSAIAVTGDIKDRGERDSLMRKFETDNYRVLLLSEVGAEGVDLQFCRTMVNYDLPWNPMRVEQRIGRIDRIGQEANSITIVNFHIPDTIDGRIYTHLYEKIGIFRSTIGDLEGIVGAQIARLTGELLRDELSPEAEEALIENAARAIEERRETEADLERSSSALVAYTDYLAENIGDSQRMGRYLKPVELRLYVDDFFAFKYPGSTMDWDTPEANCGKLRMTMAAWMNFDQFLMQNERQLPFGFSQGARGVTLTFEPAVYKKHHRSYPALVLVNHLNPLIKWITHENSQAQQRLHGVCALSVKSREMSPGPYFFLIRRLTLEGLRKREKLHYALSHLSTKQIYTGQEAESLLNQCLGAGKSLFPESDTGNTDLLIQLQKELDHICEAEIDDFRDEMEVKAQIQREQTKAHFDRKIEIAKTRIENMKASDAGKERGIRLTESQIKSLSNKKEQALARLGNCAEVSVKMNDVCCGLIQVTHG